MMRLTSMRRRLAALLVPSFLVVHLVCVCVPAAAAPIPSGAHHQDRHDCCPEDGRQAPAPSHDTSCGHCGVAQLGVAPSPMTVPPTPLVAPVVVPSPVAPIGPSFVRHRLGPSRGSPPTTSLLHRTCVLIV